jgi:hypothetical protein
MESKHRLRTALKWAAGAVGVASAAYVTYAVVTWVHYGNHAPATPEEADPLLDLFIPSYEVAERHHIGVAAPPETTFAAACQADLMQSPFIRAVFRTRELVLRPGYRGFDQSDWLERPRRGARPRNRDGYGDPALEL